MMSTGQKKGVHVRLNRAEYDALLALAESTGDSVTATATKLLTDGLLASQGKTLDKKVERILKVHEKYLLKRILAMFIVVANYDENEAKSFCDKATSLRLFES